MLTFRHSVQQDASSRKAVSLGRHIHSRILDLEVTLQRAEK